MPKRSTKLGPPCDCHGEPKAWNSDKTSRAGGYWICRVRANERARAYSRAKGRVPQDSPEYIEKLRAAKVGKAHPPDCGHCLAQRGERNANWAADGRMSYGGAHQRHRKALAGLPCAHADETCKGPLHSALKAETSESALTFEPSIKCWYSPNSEDYMPLCASHHRRYDFAHPRPHEGAA